jgi:hypothetical protein
MPIPGVANGAAGITLVQAIAEAAAGLSLTPPDLREQGPQLDRIAG